MNNTETELNSAYLTELKLRIYHMIRENHKTKKYSPSEINESVRKVIEAVLKNDY